MSKSQIKEFFEEYYIPLHDINERLHDEGHTNNRNRNEYQRDYSRILYSTSFRRLQGKMQLLGIQSDRFYRNRLTHSFEVAQIARSIATILADESGLDNIYKDDIYVVEAGALAHDIGNPPFGHHGELILHKIMNNHGGFEGNAQTLRVLNDLEKKLPKNRGLNLTLRTILSTVKYFNEFDGEKEKFIYSRDYEKITEAIENKNIKPRTVDVQIVDLADEIAYAAHDLEDALSLKLFNIDEFLYEFEGESEILKGIVKNAKKVAEKASVYCSSEEYGFLLRKEITSNLVHTLVNDIGVVEVSKKDRDKTGTENVNELGFQNHRNLVKKIKKITFRSINRSDTVQLYEKQGEVVIKSLFDALNDRQFNKDNLLLPVEFRNRKDCNVRAITDFISGMMDSYAFSFYEKLYGKGALNQIYNPKYFSRYDFTNIWMNLFIQSYINLLMGGINDGC